MTATTVATVGLLAHLLRSARVLPIVTLDEPIAAAPLVAALAAGGLTVVEVTLRTPNALDVLAAAAAAAADGEAVIGAGSVLDVRQARDAIAAGARFIVSPGLRDDVVRAAATAGVGALPGVATATELMAARHLGLSTVKLFPAETLGGIAALDALAAPFPSMSFVPTGGVRRHTMSAYLGRPAVAAVGASWITPSAPIECRDWATITSLAAEAAEIAAAHPPVERSSHHGGRHAD